MEEEINPEIISEDFPSLGECVESLRHRFSSSSITVSSIAVDGDAKEMRTIPEFLFRGESGLYPSTFSSMQRLKGLSSLSKSVRDALETISINVDRQLQEFWNI